MPLTKRFELRTDPDEYNAWSTKAAAEGISLGDWIRQACNGQGEVVVAGQPIDLNETVPPPRSRAAKVYPLCKHSKEVGCFCIDCGGIAKMRVAVNV